MSELHDVAELQAFSVTCDFVVEYERVPRHSVLHDVACLTLISNFWATCAEEWHGDPSIFLQMAGTAAGVQGTRVQTEKRRRQRSGDICQSTEQA